MTTISKTEKIISHPLEDAFDIESGTTSIVAYETNDEPVANFESYDAKDKEIEAQFQEIYEQSLLVFQKQIDDCELVEPKYTARKAEIAAMYLNTALSAAKEKANLKQAKEKLVIASTAIKKGKNVTNNNLVITSRNDLLKMLNDESMPDSIDSSADKE